MSRCWIAAAATAAVIVVGGCATTPEDRAAALARDALIVDTHIDVPYRLKRGWVDVSEATDGGDFDYPRATAGGLDVAFMSIYIPAQVDADGGGQPLADEMIGYMRKLAADDPDKFALAVSTADVAENRATGRLSIAMGMENGGPIEGDLDNLRRYHDAGIRYITLAHSRSNHISDSSYDANRRWRGLSPFGRELVGAMNDIGMMIDVSHISDEAFWQVIELTRAPVIASHSSARRFTPGFERNMDDAMIRAVGDNGGVVQINFGSNFISMRSRRAADEARAALTVFMRTDPSPEAVTAFRARYREEHGYTYATLDEVLDHFDHVVALAGIEHVGVGSDYDGVGDTLPEGLKDVASYPNLVAGLAARGYSEADIRAILGGNVMRVWRAVEAASKQSR